MFHKILRRSAFALFAIPLSVSFAQTPAIKEFERLTQTREQNIAAITKPINERYVQDLKVLLQKAVKAGDLDAADRIKAVIAIQQGLITPDSVVGRWTQTSPDGQRATILLEEGGKATFVTANGRSYPNTWKSRAARAHHKHARQPLFCHLYLGWIVLEGGEQNWADRLYLGS